MEEVENTYRRGGARLYCDYQRNSDRRKSMKFVSWWADQPPFNQVGLSFVAGVAFLALLSI